VYSAPPLAATREYILIEKRKVHSFDSLAQLRRALVHRLGFFITRELPQLIIGRWRDAASSRPVQPATLGVGLHNKGVGFCSNRRRGGYHDMHVPGA